MTGKQTSGFFFQLGLSQNLLLTKKEDKNLIIIPCCDTSLSFESFICKTLDIYYILHANLGMAGFCDAC